MPTPRRQLVVLLLVMTLGFPSSSARSAEPQIGHTGPLYSEVGAEGSGGAATGQKPESKVWVTGGRWWAAMVSRGRSGAHTIHRLDRNAWTDTGVVIDSRPTSREDVLVAGSKIYVVSRGAPGGGPSRLRRFTLASGQWTLDAGFPVSVPGAGAEALTIARDSTGRLWLAFGMAGQIRVAHSRSSALSWSDAFVLPLAGATGVTADDIAAVTSFTDDRGSAVGVMWSNQVAQADYFAVHRDGDPPDRWSRETAVAGPGAADDHLNLRSHGRRLFAVVKSSKTAPEDPLVWLLTRSPSGKWTRTTAAQVRERLTRPVLVIDPAANRLHVYATIGEGPGARGILRKSASLDAPSFGAGSVVIRGPDAQPINDASTAKRPASSATGILVLASDGARYWYSR